MAIGNAVVDSLALAGGKIKQPANDGHKACTKADGVRPPAERTDPAAKQFPANHELCLRINPP